MLLKFLLLDNTDEIKKFAKHEIKNQQEVLDNFLENPKKMNKWMRYAISEISCERIDTTCFRQN